MIDHNTQIRMGFDGLSTGRADVGGFTSASNVRDATRRGRSQYRLHAATVDPVDVINILQHGTNPEELPVPGKSYQRLLSTPGSSNGAQPTTPATAGSCPAICNSLSVSSTDRRGLYQYCPVNTGFDEMGNKVLRDRSPDTA